MFADLGLIATGRTDSSGPKWWQTTVTPCDRRMWGTVVRISEIYEHHFVAVDSSIWTIGRLGLGSAPQEPNIPGIRIERRDRDLWFARDTYLI